ncbi:hypothetical protein AAG596_11295 [Citromicrobium bathyomarinum]|uniref:hypothetical protein n=1 Tax=Citromicrobium bathyomarinum TaxID=72174 RepID=UPI00315A19C8
MKHSIMTAMGLALVATSFTAPADANPFKRLKNKVEEVKKEVEEVEEAADAVGDMVDAVSGDRRVGGPVIRSNGPTPRTRYPKTASHGDWKGRAPAAPAKYAGMTQCENLNLGNAFIAKAGEYTFSKGLNTETRSGLIEREHVQPNGCTLPGVGSGDVIYVEVDRGNFNTHEYNMQCVSFDGSQQLDRAWVPPTNNYTGKDVMLHTGNSLGYEPTATGSNSTRSGEYDKWLKSRGREMITFNMPYLHTDKAGTDFYCQYYNDKTGKSAVAFTYRRSPVGRP